MAGLDIYAAKSGDDGQFLVANFGSPINSKYDDFGLILNTDSLTGYFTSNRTGGAGDDDIYYFSVAAIDLQVTSILESTMEIMPDFKVFLKDEKGDIITSAISDENGQVEFSVKLEEENGVIRMKLNNETNYTFDVTAKGFFPNTVKYTSVGLVPGEYSLTIEMEKLSTGKQFTLDDLFYDLNKSNIRPDAALVLDDLAQILLENQEVRIEIGSHTDSRATAEYNLNLSQRRSESVVAYLIGKGVAKDRLVAKGFGESQLINHCADGIDCPDEVHQANRRTVIEILNKDIRKVKHGARDVYYF